MKLALFGDLHGHFDDFDVEYFNQSDYDYLLFTGDLLGLISLSHKVYFHLSQLKKKSFLIWGNHDGFRLHELLAEIYSKKKWQVKESDWIKVNQRLEVIQKKLGKNFHCGGYQIFSLDEETAIFLVRPHSIGGKTIGYKNFLKMKYGVETFDDSIKKMKNLLHDYLQKKPKTKVLIFLGHNGPMGLGDLPMDIWGCDFQPDYGDFGDSDFAEIISFAQSIGLSIPLVVAGHMHHRISKKAFSYIKNLEKKERIPIKKIHDTYYVNPAKVPRIIKDKNQKLHYYIYVEILEKKVKEIQEKYVQDKEEKEI
ncbi:MAG: metallophosphoesterase [Leptospiraceae bacterium]|nr:metallophosphoesterase [Leptospiraceae bacterium]MDW7975867.1 metallophosphoesterase [Leptospiraceae bacterium]